MEESCAHLQLLCLLHVERGDLGELLQQDSLETKPGGTCRVQNTM